MKRRRIRWLGALALAAVGSLAALTLWYAGILHINHPDPKRYPIVGVDVSSYQGTIDWETLASQDIAFAFVKATEGSSLVDACFERNWTGAAQAGLRVGAYHFFSFESSGAAQADLFIDAVEPLAGMLPPVVDVEYYGGFRSEKDIDMAAVRTELRVLIDRMTAAYGIKPILYASRAAYDTIIREDFSDCDLWIRSVYGAVRADIDWTFWQYSDRHVLQGYSGKERFIDMNVFCGTADAFASYGQ